MTDLLEAGAILGHQPGWVLIARGPLERAAEPPDDAPAVFAPDFFLDEPAPWWVADEWIETSVEEVTNLLPGIEPEELAWAEPGFDDYARRFAEVKRAIADGEIEKTVPVVFEEARVSNVRQTLLPALLANALDAPSPSMPYGVWDHLGGMIGATPELLFRIEAGVVRTMALAGTAGPDDAPALLSDPKEEREHAIVVEDVVDRLTPHGRVTAGEPQVLALPHLTHLHTEITLVPDQPLEFHELVKTLHPTAALGTFPVRGDRTWLDAPDRGWFGAPFGVRMPDGSGLCVVAIRNMCWSGDVVRIGAGAGIVAGSVLENEWEELRQKRRAVKRMLLP